MSDPTRPDLGPRARRLCLAGVAAAIAIGMIVRVVSWQEPANSDDIRYFSTPMPVGGGQASVDPEATINVKLTDTGTASLPFPATYRTPFTAPIAIARFVLGGGLRAFYTLIYVFALAMGVGLALFAWRLGSPIAAVIAVLLWAASPLAIETNSRLLPDTIGTAYTLFAVVLAHASARASRGDDHRRALAIAFACGFVGYLALSTRVSFVYVGLPLLVSFFFGKRKRLRLALAAAGSAAALIIEIVIYRFALSVDYPAARLRALGSTSDASLDYEIFQYDVGSFLGRYPRLLWNLFAWELVVAAVGVVGLIWLGWRRRGVTSVLVNTAAVAALGVVVFGVVGLDPIVVVMREKARYYATVAPFLYVAAAELAVVPAAIALARTYKKHVRVGAAAAAFSLAGLYLSFAILGVSTALASTAAARNGNRLLINAMSAIVEHSKEGHPVVLRTDGRTKRVVALVALDDRRWSREGRFYPLFNYRTLSLNPRPDHDHYLLIDWKRLDGNARSKYVGFAPGDPIIPDARASLRRSVLIHRERLGGYLTEAFYVPKHGVERDPLRLSVSWFLHDVAAKTSAPVGEEATVLRAGLMLDSDSSSPYGAPEKSLEPRDAFVEIEFATRATEPIVRGVQLRGWLTWFDTQGRRERQYIGRSFVHDESQKVILWGFVPAGATSARLQLDVSGKGAVEISERVVSRLVRLPADNVGFSAAK